MKFSLTVLALSTGVHPSHQWPRSALLNPARQRQSDEPAQLLVLQSSVSCASPTHARPLKRGRGFVHVRNLRLWPPPHVTVQSPQDDHSAQLPWTTPTTDNRLVQKLSNSALCIRRQQGKGRGKRGFVQRLVVNTPLWRSGMARVLKGSQFYLHTPHSYATEWTIPAFAFPAEAGTHLPTPEGWKAELALGGWLVT